MTLPRYLHPLYRWCSRLLLPALAWLPATGTESDPLSPLHPPEVRAMVENWCAACHDAGELKGNLDLESLVEEPVTVDNLHIWIRVHDRVKAGEMPPPERRRRPKADEISAFVSALSAHIESREARITNERGRALVRRMNRYEYENALRELFRNPILQVRNALPEDSISNGYNKLGEALDVSHVQMSRYLQVADTAMREVMVSREQPPERTTKRYYTWDQKQFVKGIGPTLRKTFPIVGHELQRDLIAQRRMGENVFMPFLRDHSKPGNKEKEAVVMLMSTYEPAYIRWEKFQAPITGKYILRFSGYSVWMSPEYDAITPGRRPEPIAVYARSSRNLRRVGTFDFHPEETVHEIEVWLREGETIQPDAVRLVRSRPHDWGNPLLEEDGMPGVAYKWMEVDGPILESWPTPGHRALFGDLPILARERLDAPPRGSPNATHVRVLPDDPELDPERLMRRFLEQAYRRPVRDADVERFLGVVRFAFDQGLDFTDAMLAGYTAVLASPGFIYLDSKPGKLDGYALAERLAFFLWNSPPDRELRALAASGRIHDPAVLEAQVERLLDDPRSRRFVDAFLDYWLDLRKMNDNAPDTNLYPEYQIDDFLSESLAEESQRFFQYLLDHDLPARNIVDSDFVIINERLARLYDIPEVHTARFQRVDLEPDSPRGGFMTQGSVLKVTANGTTTSPVLRGVWINERILGIHTPPPPPNIPAIETDTRGASTVRELLAKHSDHPSCYSCHKTIDPPGFALESFDVAGAWRERYRSLGAGEPVEGVGHDGMFFTFKLAQRVDASGELADGRAFDDINDFKATLLEDEARIARNIVQHLAIYATGAPVRFSDREAIAAILERAEPGAYGLRDLVHGLVQSELFLYK